MINPKYRGQGYGKIMLRYCVNYLFNNYDFNKLYYQTGSFNKPSVKILKDLGVYRDGVLREHHELDGKLWDDYIYSILRSEWKNWKKKIKIILTLSNSAYAVPVKGGRTKKVH